MKAYISNSPDENGRVQYTEAENATWAKLVKRQNQIIVDRACDEFIEGVQKLNFSVDSIPQLPEVSKVLMAHTGWQVEPVSAVIPPEAFFELLATKKFPAATFIRRAEHIDYIEEPDIFHELYGHCPLLTNQQYADFVEAYGKLALKQDKPVRRLLFRLFWFTIEFGLIQTKAGLRIYGGGILSSFSETQSSLAGDCIHRTFSALDALRTPFRIDIEQPIYYIIDELKTLDGLLDPTILDEVNHAMALGDFTPHDKLDQNKGEIDGKFAC